MPRPLEALPRALEDASRNPRSLSDTRSTILANSSVQAMYERSVYILIDGDKESDAVAANKGLKQLSCKP